MRCRYGPLRGIGVRIEDDVLLTASGAAVLSRDVPVGAAEIERLVGRASEAADASEAAPEPAVLHGQR